MSLSFWVKGQNIEWERTIPLLDNQSFVAMAEADSGYMCLGQGRDPTNFCEILKLDTAGNLLWRKPLGIGSSYSVSGDMVKVPNENNYYVLGRFSIGGFSNDFVTKINTNGDTLWTYIYSVGAIYNTFTKMIVLQDKSVLSVGFQQQSGSGDDVYVRRLDSLGNLMWHKMYALPGNQRAFDIAEMLDGSIMISGRNNTDHQILRILFNGELIDNHNLTISNGTPRLSKISPDYSNNLIFAGYDFISSNNLKGVFISFDSLYNINWQRDDIPGSWLFNLRSDTLFNRLQYTSTSPYLAGLAIYDDTTEVSSTYFPNDGNYRLINELLFSSNNNLIIGGYKDIGPNNDYWLAKISGVGEEWVPDRCAYQPPRAGFDYEYNYPVLTLRDTSSGGLKYLDTVYTWQWNTSVGTNGTDDSLVVFFDTAFTKTIDIELVIGNWYGCTDTVNQTLVLSETGLEVYKKLEVKVFPNPVKDILNVHIESYGDFVFRLYDLQGRVQIEKLLENKHAKISLSSLPRGLYFYEVGNESVDGLAIGRGKFVKE